MKKSLKKFISRLIKIHRKWGDVIDTEREEARKYKNKKRQRNSQ